VLKSLRRAARRGLELTGLIGPYYRWLERRAAAAMAEPAPDGRPMPPRELIVLVSGPSGPAWFSERGQVDAGHFRALAARHGLDLAAGAAVFDFGCGAGRIARWLAPEVKAGGGRFFGSDLNPRLVAWCAANLDGRYAVNRLKPPLDLADASLDLVYAHSVLTHLEEPTARAWLAELARVLRPGGLALLTFHDETYAQAWGPPEVRARLERRPYVVWNRALEGSNYLSAWTTRAHFIGLASAAFEPLEVIPGGREAPDQAIGVLRAR
jgi:SAM-dependent methyltransferase